MRGVLEFRHWRVAHALAVVFHGVHALIQVKAAVCDVEAFARVVAVDFEHFLERVPLVGLAVDLVLIVCCAHDDSSLVDYFPSVGPCRRGTERRRAAIKGETGSRSGTQQSEYRTGEDFRAKPGP